MSRKFEFNTIVDLLENQAEKHRDKIAYTFLLDGENKEDKISFYELNQKAKAVAHSILDFAKPGDRAVLVYAPSIDFIIAFYGCLHAGVIAVPTYPPDPISLDKTLPRFQGIVNNSQAKLLLTTKPILSFADFIVKQAPELKQLKWLTTDDTDIGRAGIYKAIDISKDTTAFLQYTSGSTSAPKGVILTHENLLYNQKMINVAFGIDHNAILMGWLPLYHDMGLIGNTMQPLYVGIHCILMSPIDFLKKPVRWLKAISKYKATVSGGPNFGYELCTRKATDEDLQTLELSQWTLAANGAEPIKRDTLEKFYNKFKVCGFKREAFSPCYGLAEASLIVAGVKKHEAPEIKAFDTKEYSRGNIVPAKKDQAVSTHLISCGNTILSQEIEIVNPDSHRVCQNQEIGEIWVNGLNVSKGYWNLPEISKKTFSAKINGDPAKEAKTYLRTGDLGFIYEDQLYITGRLKDLIIIRGANYYPQDIEQLVEKSYAGLRPGCVAAFSIESSDGEKLVCVQEVDRKFYKGKDQQFNLEEAAQTIQKQIVINFGLSAAHICLIEHGSILKTSSGKIQRKACKDSFIKNKLKILYHLEENQVLPKEVQKPKPKSEKRQRAQELKLSHKQDVNLTLWIKNWIAQRTKLPVVQIEPHEPFITYGFDSQQAIEFVGDLENHLNRKFSPSLLYDYPNITELVAYIERSPHEGQRLGQLLIDERIISKEDLEKAIAIQKRHDSKELLGYILLKEKFISFEQLEQVLIKQLYMRLGTEKSGSVAIVGIACTFPGAINKEQLTHNLLHGIDAISEIPENRWDKEKFYSEDVTDDSKTFVKRGGFIKDIETFDESLFNISPMEAASLDPQHRKILETSYLALEDAQIQLSKLSKSKTGVFIGISNNEYYDLLENSAESTKHSLYNSIGNAISMAAGRVSYAFGFQGPSLTVDTACSSSLVSVHLACQSLLNNESNLAIAGGVNAILKPDITIAFSKSNMLAKDGHCKTFDEKADGYVRSEGCGMIVLKRYADALKDGDHIYALIHGSSINQDGKTSGITAPNGPSQIRVIEEAILKSGIKENDIDYLEAHGTGTRLGDPIEIQSLQKVFNQKRNDNSALSIGSIKTNIGHLESAAGIAGLIKLALSLKHSIIYPHRNLNKLNPYLARDEINYIIPQQATPWIKHGHKKFAGVSSFGFSGTNAHIVLSSAEYNKPSPKQVKHKTHILTISAKSITAFEQQLKHYQNEIEKIDTEDLYTFCIQSHYQNHYNYRLAIQADSLQQLKENFAKIPTQHIQFPELKNNTVLFLNNESLNPITFKQLALEFPYYSKLLNEYFQLGKQYFSYFELNKYFVLEDNEELKFVGDLVSVICYVKFLRELGINIDSYFGMNLQGVLAAIVIANELDAASIFKLLKKLLPAIINNQETNDLKEILATVVSDFNLHLSSKLYKAKESKTVIDYISFHATNTINSFLFAEEDSKIFALTLNDRNFNIRHALQLHGSHITTMECLGSHESKTHRIHQLLVYAYNHGAAINWSIYAPITEKKGLKIPSYPLQKRKYWPEPKPLQQNIIEDNQTLFEIPGIGFAYPKQDVSEKSKVSLLGIPIIPSWAGISEAIEAVSGDASSYPIKLSNIQFPTTHVIKAQSNNYGQLIMENEHSKSTLKYYIKNKSSKSWQNIFNSEINNFQAEDKNESHKELVTIRNHNLSIQQKRFWFMQNAGVKSSSNNIYACFNLNGEIDLPKLKHCISESINSFDILRSYFTEEGSIPYIKTLNTIQFEVQEFSLSYPKAEEQILVEINQDFNFRTSPLVKALLFLDPDDKTNAIFGIIIPHIICDVISLGILVKDIFTRYEHKLIDKVYNAIAANNYMDLAHKQSQADLGKQIEYWKARIAEYPFENKTPYYISDDKINAVVDLQELVFDEQIGLSELKKEAVRHNITLFTYMAGIFNLLISQYTQSNKFLIGTPVSGRNSQEFAKTVGNFAYPLPLEANISKEMHVSDFFKQANEDLLNAFENQQLPFESLVKAVNPPRTNNRIPITQILFALLPDINSYIPQSLPFSVEYRHTRAPLQATQGYELFARLIQNGEKIIFQLAYDQTIYPTIYMKQLLTDYHKLCLQLPEKLNNQVVEIQKEYAPWLPQLCIASNFTALNLTEPLITCAHEVGLNIDIQHAPYNQIHQELSNPNSLLNTNYYGLNIILLRIESWFSKESQQEDGKKQLDSNIEEFINLLTDKQKQYPIPYHIFICPPSITEEKNEYITLINVGHETLIQRLNEIELVAVTSYEDLLSSNSIDNFIDEKTEKTGDIPYTEDFFIIVATHIFKQLFVDCIKESKQLILSFDEDDALLTNDTTKQAIKTVLEYYFNKNLSISLIIKSHKKKYAQLMQISQELKIPSHMIHQVLDITETHKLQNTLTTALLLGQSFITLDNVIGFNTEKEIISLSQILKDPGLLSYNLFKQLDSDLQATNVAYSNVSLSYQADAQVELVTMTKEHFERIEKLSYQSDFTLNGQILNPENLKSIIDQEDVTAYAIYVKDNLNNYGNSGCIIFEIQDQTIMIKSFILSCPALGRFVEYNVLLTIFEQLSNSPAKNLHFDYEGIARNKIFKNYLQKIIQAGPLTDEIGIASLRENIKKQNHSPKSKTLSPPQNLNNVFTITSMLLGCNSEAPHYFELFNQKLNDLKHIKNVTKQRLRSKRDLNVDESKYIPPQNEVQRKLATIFSEVINISKPSVQTDFFKMGGSSLLLVQAQKMIFDELKIDLPLTIFFKYSSIEALGNYIEKQGQHIIASQNMLSSKPKSEPIILSHQQERLYFLYLLDPTSTQYSLNYTFSTETEIDIQVFKKAIELTIQKHEILQRLYDEDKSIAPIEKVLDFNFVEQKNPLKPLDIEKMVQTTKQGLDLQNGPLLKVFIIKTPSKHTISMSVQHIVCDGLSVIILKNEISYFYDLLIKKQLISNKNLEIQYTDYAYWQKNIQDTQQQEIELQYWIDKLSPIPEIIKLPRKQTKLLETADNNQKFFHFELSQVLVHDLMKLPISLKSKLFNILVTILSITLSRYSNQNDICIAIPIANRDSSKIQDIIGCFINMIILRMDVNNQNSFLENLKTAEYTISEALAHHSVPFEKVISKLNIQRNLQHAPIAQVLFNLMPFIPENEKFFGNKVETLFMDGGASEYDFSIQLHTDMEQNLSQAGYVKYNSQMYSQSLIEQFIHSFQLICNQVIQDQKAIIENLVLVEARDLLKRIESRPAIDKNKIQHQTLINLFQKQCQKTPNASALIWKEFDISYIALEQESNRLANHIIDTTKNKNKFIGIYMTRSLDMIIAIWAVIKSGAAYIPLAADYPKKRLLDIIEDSQMKTIIVQKGTPLLSEELMCSVVEYDYHNSNIQHCSNKRPDITVDPFEPAYAIFTSGSTGKPKGVVNTHAGICNKLAWMQEEHRLSANDRILQKTSAIFDVSVEEIFWPLINGATLVIAKPEGNKDPYYLIDMIEKYQISVIHFVPSMLNVFLDVTDELYRCHSLRVILCGGEVLTTQLMKKSFESISCDLYNLYGPTEAAVGVTHFKCHENITGNTVPIGWPGKNVYTYILDENLNLLPNGVIGELFIGGLQLSKGYLNQADLTAKYFIKDPFRPGNKIYRTGDLARYLENGEIEYIGRKDFQVKLRGQRIELGEIETQLRQLPMIKDAIVTVYEPRQDNQQLVAYIILTKGQQAFNGIEIKAQLKNKLPVYMLPNSFMVLDKFPQLPNGKVDRKNLPIPDLKSDTIENKPALIQPQCKLEEQLHAIFKQVLKREEISIKDDFFDIGGHSLLAVNLFTQIENQMGVKLELATIFTHSNIEALAQLMQSEEKKQWSPIVKLNNKIEKPAIFFIHPIGGNIMAYQELAKALTKNYSLYGIQAYGFHQGQTPHTSITQMVDYYTKHIEQLNLNQKISLVGWSNGGIIAFELANVLHKKGIELEKIFLIDSWASHTALYEHAGKNSNLNQLIELYIKELEELNSSTIKLDLDLLAKSKTENKYMLLFTTLLQHQILEPEHDYNAFKRMLEIYQKNYLAVSRYEPKTFSGKLNLIKATEKLQYMEYPNESLKHLGWEQVCSHVNMIEINANHYSIMKKSNANKLAKIINEIIQAK